ncbi:hypothetical protein M0Q50_02460 [bacterium]|jgi:hypothetical protein|nr:hypothetical protein [bacterium]
MKTFEKYKKDINLDKQEELFLELAQLDELDIRFDFIELPEDLFYFYKEKCFFVQDKNGKCFRINDDDIWSIFRNNIGMSYTATQSFMNIMIKKYFGLYAYNTLFIHIYTIDVYHDVFFD